MGARAAVTTVAALAALAISGCGGDSTYSASAFRACLDERGANPVAIEQAASEADVSSVVGDLARDAERANGALNAFGAADETFPGASESAFLFFADQSAAERAARRVGDAVDRLESKLGEPSPYDATVRRNLLTVTTRSTGAQRRAVDECLERSEE